ncbi:MAG: Serine/threonine-protein kinase pkn3 [Labilithrix sp.]|nr:Serine/threonine-protein kinase pkn3 [Labilithrix sp.]
MRLAPGPEVADDCSQLVSLPSAARQDDTVPAEPKAMVCPRCKKRWPLESAPTVCPIDGLGLVRPKDLVDSDDDPMIGRTLEGRYTIVAKLGAGSMGTVYRAKQHAMGREVAIKILRGDRATDESAKARFMREARANSLLASPNTVTVFDFGQSESGEFYLAMELLEGESLGQRLARVGRLPPAQAVDACRQALRSLGEAHAKGIIHRDLKPDNLFFARVLTSTSRGENGAPDGQGHDEIVKVLDFGIAKMIDADTGSPMNVVETQAGTVFGTPRYMSPEQAQGKTLDARSDLYSLAVILYQMLTGRPPFTDNDAVVVMARHIKSVPKRPNEAAPDAMLARELEDVVMRTLAKDPKNRPASADVFAGELFAALEAHGAQTSGVRASVTNAAGIRVPESMRPPPMALPKPHGRRFPLALLAVPVVVLGAAVGVYFGLARHRAPPPAPIAAPSAESAAGNGAGSRTTSTSAASGGELDDGPTVTPDSLPKASSTASPGAAGKGAKRAGTTPSGRTSGKPAAQHSAAGAPSAAPSAVPQYGIFD